MNFRIAIPVMICVLAATAVVVATSLGGPSPSSTADAVPATIKSDTLRPGQALPAPSGKVLLRFAGGAHAQLDMKTLDRMPQSTLKVFEPFVKRNVSFTGVRFADLLPIVGVDGSTPTLFMRALDDYKVTLDVAELVAAGGLLATRAGGKRIPIAKGGQVRLVFPPGSKMGDNTDNWIWSIATITARR